VARRHRQPLFFFFFQLVRENCLANPARKKNAGLCRNQRTPTSFQRGKARILMMTNRLRGDPVPIQHPVQRHASN